MEISTQTLLICSGYFYIPNNSIGFDLLILVFQYLIIINVVIYCMTHKSDRDTYAEKRTAVITLSNRSSYETFTKLNFMAHYPRLPDPTPLANVVRSGPTFLKLSTHLPYTTARNHQSPQRCRGLLPTPSFSRTAPSCFRAARAEPCHSQHITFGCARESEALALGNIGAPRHDWRAADG